MSDSTPFKLALSVQEARSAAPVGHQSIYDAINTKQLRAKKNGKRTIILVDDYKAWIASLPDYEPKAA